MLRKKLVGVAASALLLTACSQVNGEGGGLAVLSENAEQTISMEEAKQIAFNHAGVDGTKAVFDDEEYDRDDNDYELEFTVDNVEYEYDIDAETGKILKAEKDDADDAKRSGKDGELSFISLEEAKQIAFDHAEVDGEKAVFDDEELDEDDKLYELEFTLDGVEYEFDIDAISGRVLEFERDDVDDDDRDDYDDRDDDYDDDDDDDRKAARAPQSQQKQAPKQEQKQAQAKPAPKQAPAKQAQPKQQQKQAPAAQPKQQQKQQAQSKPAQKPAQQAPAAKPVAISRDRALQIALSHAGVSRNQISDLEIELDSDDGVRAYEVEFEVGDVEYEYDIRESDGSILDVEIDR